MIDVIFLLLIFFVCTSSFQEKERLLPTNLAQAQGISKSNLQTSEKTPFEIVRIRVYPDYWQIDGRMCEKTEQMQHVVKELANVNKNIPVIIEPEGDAAYEKVLAAYDACRLAKLERIMFSAKRK